MGHAPNCLVHLVCCPLVVLILVLFGSFGAQLNSLVRQKDTLDEFHEEVCKVSQVTIPSSLPPAPGWVQGDAPCPSPFHSRWASCIQVVSLRYGLVRGNYPDQTPCTTTGNCAEPYDQQLEWAGLIRDSWFASNQTVCYQRDGIAYLRVYGSTSSTLGKEQRQVEKVFALLACLACLAICVWVVFIHDGRRAAVQREPLLAVQIETSAG